MKNITFDESKWQLVPVERKDEMCAAAVKFANGDDIYEKVLPAVLKIEEEIYWEAYLAMLSVAPQPPTEPLKELSDGELESVCAGFEELTWMPDFFDAARAVIAADRKLNGRGS